MSAAEWKSLRERFEGFRLILTPIDLYGEEQFERLKLSLLTYGQIKSAHLDKIAHGIRFYAYDINTVHLLEDMMTVLGYIGEAAPGWRSPFDVVQDAIATETLTLEFVRAWGTLEWCAGVLNVLRERDLDAYPDFQRKLKGAMNEAIVQQHWYAHWMARNAPSLDKDARHNENTELMALCDEIANCKVAPWSPYPKEWFGALLDREGADLNSSLIRLSKGQLRKMVGHPLLTPDVLPPLTTKEFKIIHRDEP